jgi:hypothetical protein
VLGEDAVAQRHGLAAGGDAQPALQHMGHAFELAQRRVAIAVGCVAAHEGEMGEFVAVIELDELLPAIVEAQQIEVAQPELLAALLPPTVRSGRGAAAHRRSR